jgi:thiamine biosynthesis lipoprotein
MRWNRALAGGLIWRVCILVLSSAVAAPSAGQFEHKKKYAMGTVFEIVAYGESPAETSSAMDQAFQEIVRLDNVMSDYKADSALSRLNRSAYLQAQPVPSDLYRVIEESLRYSRLSQGKFDVTVGPLVKVWKAAMRGERAPTAEEEDKLRACVGYQKVELLPPDRIQFRSPCLQIDLGSIGKGYALDRAAEVLRVHGISRALLNAGGSSIYAMGSPPGQRSWLVHLRDPSNKVDPQVMLSDNSVSTSEQTPASVLPGTESAGHIIDPDKGLPLKTPFAVSVVAKTATASDALSTTLLLVGPGKGTELVRDERDVAAIWISADGQLKVASSGPPIVLPPGPQGGTPATKSESGGVH